MGFWFYKFYFLVIFWNLTFRQIRIQYLKFKTTLSACRKITVINDWVLKKFLIGIIIKY